jgi:hypothetical protein
MGFDMARRNAPFPDGNGPLERRWSTTETRLCRVGWTMVGAGFVLFGVTTWRSDGRYIVVAITATRIDLIIWALTFVGVFGGFATLYAWAIVNGVHYFQEKHARRTGAGDSGADIG